VLKGNVCYLCVSMFKKTFTPPGNDRVRRNAALVIAALILPALAFAGTDNGKGNGEQNNGNQNGRNKTSPVPEASSGWVLAPIAGIVLLLSWRQLTRARA
jgi:hypothetical protein